MGRLLHVGIFLAVAGVTLFVLQARSTGSREEEKAEEPLSERYKAEIESDPELAAIAEILKLDARRYALEDEARVLIRVLAARKAPGMHVPEDALRAAFDAARDPSAFRLARLNEAGAGGFRAIVAILYAGWEIPDLGTLVATSWDPLMQGEEQALVAAAESDVVPALAALGYCDTPRSRDYLLARLRGGDVLRECVASLGRLREARALPHLASAMRRHGTARTAAADAIAEIGGDDARAILVGYLREPRSDLLAEAASALRRVDPEAARSEARSLLESPRRLTAEQARTLRECAGG